MAKLSTTTVEAENAIGIFLSLKKLEQSKKFLTREFCALYKKFENYESAKAYLQEKYKNDYELRLEELKPNFLIFRDTHFRHNFYFYSENAIAYGISREEEERIESDQGIMNGIFVYTDTTQEAIAGARSGFNEIYEGKNYYSGPLYSGVPVFSDAIEAIKYHKKRDNYLNG